MKTSKTLFYLDDDSDDLMFFRDAAESLNHIAVTFLTANEMMYTLRHETTKPDIIFLDVHMPLLNGEEMLNLLKKSEFKDIPIVMISGVYPKKLVRYYIEAGASYLMKKSHDFKKDLEEVLRLDLDSYRLIA